MKMVPGSSHGLSIVSAGSSVGKFCGLEGFEYARGRVAGVCVAGFC